MCLRVRAEPFPTAVDDGSARSEAHVSCSRVSRAARLVFLLVLARWTWIFLFWPMRQDVIGASFLHVISIPFHEAGHILFMPFGDFLTSLGGSLTQVMVPVVCWIAFATSHPNPFGQAVMCWWAGQNLLDVAIYINDARSLSLVLLGGYTGAEVEGHDWERILGTMGLTAYDHRIAWAVHVIGAAMMVGALVWGAVLAMRGDRRTEDVRLQQVE